MHNNNPHIKGRLRVVFLILPYIFIITIFSLIGMLIADIDLRLKNPDRTVYQSLILSFFNFLGTLLVLLFFVKFVDNERFINIGLRLKNKAKDFFAGILCGLFIMALAYILLLSLNQIIFLKFSFLPLDLVNVLFLFVFVSLTEELLFRGYILRNFMYSFNKTTALIASSLLFSIMHGFNPDFSLFSFINLFLAGILLGISYTFTKNLWFPIALHFSWNFFQSLFGFNVSGLDSYSFIEFEIPESNLINGGEFGFEGSILSIFIQAVLIICIYLFYNTKTKKKGLTGQ